MLNIECLDLLTISYNNVVKYPVLGLYLKDRLMFTERYLVINEPTTVSICDKTTFNILCIDKSDLKMTFENKIFSVKRSKKKLFGLGNIEVYRSQPPNPIA